MVIIRSGLGSSTCKGKILFIIITITIIKTIIHYFVRSFITISTTILMIPNNLIKNFNNK